MSDPTLETQRHPFVRRTTHWLFALAIIVMIGSGWRIYDNEKIFAFIDFPGWASLGGGGDASYAQHNEGGTGSAIAWHFAGMWLLVAAFGVYVVHSLVTGHFRRDFLPVGPRAFLRDLWAAMTFRLAHRLGEYNAVQRVAYWVAMVAIAVMVASGLAIWKPVQLSWLTALFGGFPAARVVHFVFMAVIVGFLVIHVALVALVPKTLVAMVTGKATATPHGVGVHGAGT